MVMNHHVGAGKPKLGSLQRATGAEIPLHSTSLSILKEEIKVTVSWT